MRAVPANLWRNLTLPGALWYLAAAGFVTTGGGILSANKFVLPALDVVAVLPIFVWVRLHRGFQGAAGTLLFWALCKAVAVASFTVLFPGRAASAVAFGPAYADGMWIWLGSGADLAGVGAAGAWRLEEVAIAAGAGVATGGLGGLAAAAVLLNCLAYFWGTLFLRAAEPWKVVIWGWPPWEVFRALGLVNVMLAAAEPLASRLLGRPARARDLRDGIIIGFLMLALAYVAHISLAPWWREMLAPALIFEAPAF